eukprot:tig00020601_g11729.t1
MRAPAPSSRSKSCPAGYSYALDLSLATPACVPAKAFCYPAASCGGTPTVSTFTTYNETGVAAGDVWARCPGGTVSFKNAGSNTCTAVPSASLGVKCFTDTACKSATFVWAFNAASCPAGYFSALSGTSCSVAKSQCYSGASCGGTMTYGPTGTYKEAGLTDLEIWSRCPAGTQTYKDAGSTTCKTDVVKGVKCHTDKNCSSADFQWAFDADSCPVAYKYAFDPATSTCAPTKLLCYSGTRCDGSEWSTAFETYKENGVATAQSWLKCEEAHGSYKDAGSNTCRLDPYTPVQCFTDLNCTNPGSATVTAAIPQLCPSGYLAAKDASGTCLPAKLTCFSDTACSANGSATSFLQYREVGVADVDTFNRCPGSLSYRDANSATCETDVVRKGVECYSGTAGLCSGAKTYAYDAASCPAGTVSHKCLGDSCGAEKDVCVPDKLVCYSTATCGGTASATTLNVYHGAGLTDEQKMVQCPKGTLSYTDTASPGACMTDVVKGARCFSTPDCQGTSTAVLDKTLCPADTFSIWDDVAGTCTNKGLVCYPNAGCSGASTPTSHATYVEAGKTDQEIWAKCPGGTKAYRDAGESAAATCKPVPTKYLGAACYPEYNYSKDTGSNWWCGGNVTWAFNPASCPADTKALKNSSGCFARKLVCFNGEYCSGTYTIQDAHVTHDGVWSRCPGGTRSYMNGSDTTYQMCQTLTPDKWGAKCYADSGTCDAAASFTWAEKPTDCPLTSLSTFHWNTTSLGGSRAETCTSRFARCHSDFGCTDASLVQRTAVTSTGPIGWNCPSGTQSWQVMSNGAPETPCRALPRCYTTSDCSDTPTIGTLKGDAWSCKSVTGAVAVKHSGESSTCEAIPTGYMCYITDNCAYIGSASLFWASSSCVPAPFLPNYKLNYKRPGPQPLNTCYDM